MEEFKRNIETLEEKRSKLVEQVKGDLETYKDQVTQFNLLTASKKAGGFWDTNNGIKMVQYDERYKNEFELHNVQHNHELLTQTGYVYDKVSKKVTFTGYLGRTFHTNLRDGNGLFITLKFNKEFNPENIIKNISNLLDTLIAYRGNDKNPNRTIQQDLVDIAKEGIQVLEAFTEIAEKFPADGHISVKGMIEEYKEIIDSLA